MWNHLQILQSFLFFFFSPAFWLYNCLCFEQTKESAVRTSPLEPDTSGPFRPHPRSFLLLLNYSLLLKSDVESSFLCHLPPKKIAYNLSHPSLVLLLSAQDPETPPNLSMASLDLWCLPITIVTQKTTENSAEATGTGLTYSVPGGSEVWDHRWQKNCLSQISPLKLSMLKPPSHVIWWQMYSLSHNYCKMVINIT